MDLYFRSRAEGFGAEVKRRIMLGTYVLSSGYYDAYYLRAQQVRTLIRRDFLEAYREVDALITPTSPIPAFKLGEKSADPLAMYLCDVYTIGVNLAGLPGISMPCGFTRGGLPIGLQLIGQPFREAELLAIARAYERPTTGTRRGPRSHELRSRHRPGGARPGQDPLQDVQPVAAGYGLPENTLTDPVVLALPGALPVMNRAALDADHQGGPPAGLRDRPGLQVGPQELLLSRFAEELPDLAV